MKKIFFLVGVLFSFHHLASAQQGWEAGAWLGTSYYFGDLNTNLYLGAPKFAGGLILRHNFNNRLCFKISANYASVAADDAKSKNVFEHTRNLSFRSNIFDGSAQFEFNFLPYVHGSRDEFFTPYLLGGFSVAQFNPKALYEGKWVELRSLGTEGQFRSEEYGSITGAFLYGGGFKIDLNPDWSINVEIAARKVFTDYLDDVSGTYPDKRTLEKLRGKMAVELSDRSIPNAEGLKIGEAGRQRGNSRDNDTYLNIGVGILYYFGDLKCPPITRKF